MVIGLDKFIEYFKDYQGSYIIIGGTACDIIVEDAGFEPRATDDIDIVLIVEALKPEFVNKFWDFIKDDKILPADQETARGILSDQFEDILSDLTPKEQKILKMRFGLGDGIVHTLEEVGKEFNVTRERIRQIEAKALDKIRQNEKVRKLESY